MKLPSLEKLIETSLATLRRFPYVALCALLACGLSIFLVEVDEPEPMLLKLLMTFALGVPLFCSITLFLEGSAWKASQGLALRMGGWLFLAAYYLIGQADVTTNYYMRYAQLSLAFHLLVSFAPFLIVGQVQGFWQFNRKLFLRFCLSFLYASVFFCGLALALGSLDFLFDVKLHGKLFGDLWFLSVFLLQTLHFLAGVPVVDDALDEDQSFPFGLKIFTQFLLLPLVALYTFILYAYFVKIGLSQDWPKGFVSWLVVGQSVFGIFCLLLLYPLSRDSAHAWIGKVTRMFYMAIPALVVMLFIAVGKRLVQYDVTERRYLVVILGAWLLGICIYFLRSAAGNIKVIPMSLAALALASSCGPWGAYQWARRSQQARFEAVLTKNHMLLEGKFQKPHTLPGPDDQEEIFASLDYLTEAHGVEGVRQWLTPAQLVDLEKDDFARGSDIFDVRFSGSASKVAKMLGLNYADSYQRKSHASSRYYYVEGGTRSGSNLVDVSGYDWMLPVNAWEKRGKISQSGPWIYFNKTEKTLEVYQDGVLKSSFALTDWIAGIAAKPNGGVPVKDMTFEAEKDGVLARLSLTNLSVSGKPGAEFKIESANGQVLWKIKP